MEELWSDFSPQHQRRTMRLAPKQKSGPVWPKCGAGCLFSPQRVGRLHSTNLQPGSQTPGRRQSRAGSRMYRIYIPLGCKLTSPVRRLLAGGAAPQQGARCAWCSGLRQVRWPQWPLKSYPTPATLPRGTTVWNRHSWLLSLCSWNPRKRTSICPSSYPTIFFCII